MLRRSIPLILLVASTVGAQTELPSTRAGNVFRAWQIAFNSGDSAKILDWYRTYLPERIEQGAVNFRVADGGFDIVSIENSQPRHIELVLKARKNPTTYYGVIDVSERDPLRIASSTMNPLPAGVTAASLRLDATKRTSAIEGAIAQLDEYYVFPEVAHRIADSLRARAKRGEYDSYVTGATFAAKLDSALAEIAHDKHMHIDYSVRVFTPAPVTSGPAPAPTPDMIARRRAQLDAINCGFVKAEQLPGNVGYLKFDGFIDVESCGSTAAAAMSFLAGTNALIVDLRENGGGSPEMVSYICSYLFSQRTHLNDLWDRKSGKTTEFWTRDDVPGRKFGGEKPVYVLTSSRTFSGAEEFTYNLKTQKRATIVGETTGGGAHPVAGRRADDHFVIAVPGARAINPITHTNWEGVGVEPDVKVPASEALVTAQRLVKERARP